MARNQPSDPARFTGPVTGPVFLPAPALWKAQIAPIWEDNGLSARGNPMDSLYAVVLFAISASVIPAQQHHGDERRRQHRDTQEPALLMGICVGFTLMLLLVGLGFGQLFTRFPELHMFISARAPSICSILPGSSPARRTGWLTTTEPACSVFQGCPVPVGQCQGLGGCHRCHRRLHQRGKRPFEQHLVIALTFFIVSFPCVGLWLLCGSLLKALAGKRSCPSPLQPGDGGPAGTVSGARHSRILIPA